MLLKPCFVIYHISFVVPSTDEPGTVPGRPGNEGIWIFY